MDSPGIDGSAAANAAPQIHSTTAAATTRGQWAILVAILVLAAVLRLIFLSSTEANFDELWHLELSTGRGSAHSAVPLNIIQTVPALTSLGGAPPWYAIPASLDSVTHPPLFSLLLRAWRSVFGESITEARLLSALLSILCVLALFLAARELHDTPAALWACTLLALSSAQIDVAQEVRNYPLLILTCLCAAAALARIERLGLTRLRMIALVCACLGAVFTHYFALPAMFAMGCYAILRIRGHARWTVPSVIVVAYVVLLILWGSMAIRQSHAVLDASGVDALGDPDPSHVLLSFQRAASVPIRMLFEPRNASAGIAMLSAAIFGLPLIMVKSSPKMLLWWLWLSCVVGFALALDLARGTKHLEHLRHTILAGPAVCTLLVLIVSGSGRRLLSHGAPAVLALACAMSLGLTYTRASVRYRGLGTSLAANSPLAEEPVVFYSDPSQTFWSGWLLLASSHYSGTFPRPVLRLDAPAHESLLAQLRRWNGAWLVWVSREMRPGDILPGIEMTSSHEYTDPILASARHLEWAPATQPAVGSATTQRAQEPPQ